MGELFAIPTFRDDGLNVVDDLSSGDAEDSFRFLFWLLSIKGEAKLEDVSFLSPFLIKWFCVAESVVKTLPP